MVKVVALSAAVEFRPCLQPSKRKLCARASTIVVPIADVAHNSDRVITALAQWSSAVFQS